MSREMFMDLHDELIEEYMAENPDATEEEAIDSTADQAMEKVKDHYDALADYQYERMKEGRGEDGRTA
jgi:hypothetical protein